jgi:aspartyl-tRNA(Asn)/glutamyl-tRNA(Gln) amidotransferase subunit C
MRREDIHKLAALARIKLASDEEESLAGEIEGILGYVAQVTSAATSADFSDAPGPAGVTNVLREDANPHASGLHTEVLLEAAPARHGNFFKVKRIL